MEILPFRPGDPARIAAAFAPLGWPGKDEAAFRRYLDQQEQGERATFLATVDDAVAGYVTVLWRSRYAPFRERDVPEIADLNVLDGFRRRGIGNALLDAAEAAIGERGPTSGLGVGLYADYAAAHRIYLARGYRPDGLGVAYAHVTAEPGQSVRVDDDLNLMMTREVR
ncbi:GNAT family N-acetyltransferase [Hamadaea tsunoensis]|uniref:GNAT family N-acetyltransferase n=1 Tax=Hamadaea tsunoensis TaxID=53368 RepID=UPI000683F404|nr:GNAT family N-acetyltransferase [Hamadaea tsunoensis]